MERTTFFACFRNLGIRYIKSRIPSIVSVAFLVAGVALGPDFLSLLAAQQAERAAREAAPANDPGQWRLSLEKNRDRVHKNVFPRVDLKYSGTNEEMKVVLYVNPRADLGRIVLGFNATESIAQDSEGAYVIRTREGIYLLKEVEFSQRIQDLSIRIPGGFEARNVLNIGLWAGSYDRKQTLQITMGIGFVPVPQTPLARFVDAVLAVNITASKTDALFTDVDADTKADPGDTLQYDVVVSNTGTTDATGVTFDDVLDDNTTLVTGSVNVSPLAFDDSYTTVGNTLLEVARPASGNPAVTSTVKVTDNDVEFLGDTFALTTITGGSSTNGGTVDLFADGSFTYLPPVGFTGTDTFTYTLTDPDGLTGTGTVSITVSNLVWYVNNAGAAGDGRSSSPFQTLAPVNGPGGAGDPDAANDFIYMFTGAGNYTTGIELESGQQLIGNGVALIVGGFTLRGAGASPALTNAAGDGVLLSTNNTLSGFALGNASGSAINGSSFGNLTVSSVTINSTGRALNLSIGNASSVTFGSITSSGGTNNINLANVTGTWNLGGGGLSGATSHGFAVDGQNGTVNYSGSIGNTNARSVSIINKTGGTVALSGAVTGSGQGIFLNNNAGATTNLTGGISLNTGTNAAFTATGGGTLNLTGSTNDVTTTTGVGINIANVGIGGSGATFRNVTVSGAATNGIILNTTSGAFQATGTTNLGTAPGTGPTGVGINISNYTSGSITFGPVNINRRGSTGIQLSNVAGTVGFGAVTIPNQNNSGGYGIRIQSSSANVTIASATISDANLVTAQNDADTNGIPETDGDGDAIFLTGNTGSFALNGGTLSNCGNDCIDLRGCSTFVLSNVNISNPGLDVTGATGAGFGGHGIFALNLTGTNSITGGTISGFNTPNRDGLLMLNNVSTAMNMTIHGSTFQNAIGNRGIGISGQATANMTVTVGGPTNNVATNVTFQNISATALQSTAGGVPAGSTATVNLTVQNSTFQNAPTDGKNNLIAGVAEAGTSNVIIRDNTFNNVFITASTGEALININNDGLLSGNQLDLLIENNNINNVGSALNNCGGGATPCRGPLNAILVFIDDAGNVPNTLIIHNNTLTNIQQGGIFLDMANTGAPLSIVNAKITNNCIGRLRSGGTCTGADAPVGVGAGSTIQSGIRVERRRNNSQNGNVLISGNIVRNGAGGPGSTLNGPGIFARTKANSNLSATVTNNNVDTNLTGGVAEMRFDTNANEVGDIPTPTQCDDISNNTLPGGAAAIIDLRQINGTHNVEQTSAANVTALNGGTVTVNTTGTINFNVACAVPPAAPVLAGNASDESFGFSNNDQSKLSFEQSALDNDGRLFRELRTAKSRQRATVAPAVYRPLPDSEPQVLFVSNDAAFPKKQSGSASRATLAPVPQGPISTINIGTLPAGKSVTIRFRAIINDPLTSPPAATQVCNQGTVSGSNFSDVLTDDPDLGGVADPTCTPLDVEADLSITKTDGQASDIPGTSITYTITASNAGPNQVTGATVADTFPGSLTGVTWNCVASAGSSCTAGGSGNINDTAVDLLVGGSATYTMTATIDPGATGTLSNTATITPPVGVSDPIPADNSATDMTTLTPQADLSITKTDGVATATPGGSVTYTITAINSGPSDAPGATVADTFPGILTSTWTCAGAGGGSCTAGPVAGDINDTVNLPAGGSVTYTVNATIDPSATGSLVNTATVTEPGGVTDPDAANNSATDTDTLTPEADLSITKTDGVTTATPGGSVTYTITASNAGPSDAPSATVADTFPAILTATWTCVGAGGGTCTAGPVAGDINDTVNLPAGASVTYTVNATIDPSATGTLANTATVSSAVSDPDAANNSATDTDTLAAAADLSITKTDGVATAVPGGSVTYTITASNAGPSDAPGATVADTFPASLTATWTCVGTGGGTCTAAGSGDINDTVNLPAGASVTYTVNATIDPAATGSLVNTATVTEPGGVTDPAPGNNSATDTDTLTPEADLSITKTDGVTTATPGGSVFYTITASNAGPSDAPGATVADTFPAMLTATWTCVGAGGGTCTAGPVAGDINDTVNLPAGASVTYTVNATIDPAATGSLVNTATVTEPGGVTDPNAANNSATDTDTLTPTADLSITKTDGLTNATPGQATTYTIVVSNAGPSSATGAAVADTFPAALTGVTYTSVASGGATGNTAAGAGDINDSVNLPAGASVTYTVNATIDAAFFGTLSNTATVTAPGGVTDPVPGNNSATDTTSVAQPPGITKSFSPTQIQVGGISTMTITIDNPNGNGITGVAFTDNLPAGMTVATPSNASTTCTGGTLTAVAGSGVVSLSGASIGANASCTVTVDVTASTAGDLVNVTGDVTSNEGGSGGTATDTLTVVALPDFSKAFAPNQIAVGGVSTLTFTITNPAANTIALTGVAFTDNLPSGVVVATPPNESNTCTGGTLTAVAGSGVISLSGSSVAVNTTCTVTVDVTATSGGDKVNITGNITSTESGDGGTATDTLTVVAPPDIAKVFNPDAIQPLQISTLTFTITNPAENTVALTGIDFTDNFPAGIQVANPPNDTNTCGGTFAPLAGDFSVSLTGGTIPVGNSCTLTVDVTATVAGVYTNTTGNVTSNEGGAGNTATAVLTAGKSTQNIAVDAQGRFVVFAADPGCGKAVLFYQALAGNGLPLGAPVMLTSCGLTTGDASGIDLLEDEGDSWISFGGTLPADGKYLMKIGPSGNVMIGPTQVAVATKFGSTAGATAIVLKGCCKIRMYLIGDGGKVYRVVIDKIAMFGKRPRDLAILALSQDSLQVTQGAAKPFLSFERPDQVLKGFGLSARGKFDGTSWRLSPTTDGGHEVGGVAPDGLAALSNNSDPPLDRLYFQPLDANGLPVGSPKVVSASADIAAVDLTNELPGGIRFVVYSTDTGTFLQVIDTAGNKLGAVVQIQ